MLKDIFNCKPPFVGEYIENIKKNGDYNLINYKLLKSTCNMVGVCHWALNNKMCQGPICPNAIYNETKSVPDQCKQQCIPPEKYKQKQKEILINRCKQSEASVVKARARNYCLIT